MDCKTARLLLDYARPNSHELDAAETRAFEEHLAGCADCDQLAGADRRADEVIGRAMRAVDVPDQLRARILTRLTEERGQRRRRWPVYTLRGAIAAAALLLLAAGLWRWSMIHPAFPAERLVTQANDWVIAPPDRKQVQEAFKAQGVEMAAPADLNYNYVRFLFLANVEGRPTPTLLFNNKDKNSTSGLSQHALVYIVSDNQFDAEALPANFQGGNGYEYKCFIRRPEGDHFGYVAYYTGDDLNWLRSPLTSPLDGANGN
jgi:Putative zinc-finger